MEGFEVSGRFAEADVADREFELILDRDGSASLGSTIEFCEDEAR